MCSSFGTTSRLWIGYRSMMHDKSDNVLTVHTISEDAKSAKVCLHQVWKLDETLAMWILHCTWQIILMMCCTTLTQEHGTAPATRVPVPSFTKSQSQTESSTPNRATVHVLYTTWAATHQENFLMFKSSWRYNINTNIVMHACLCVKLKLS